MEGFIWLWAALSLPVMLLFHYIYTRTRGEKAHWHSLSKSGASFVAVMTAALGASLVQKTPQSGLLVLAAALCCASDFILDKWFVPGMAGFALAHFVFIGYMLCLQPPHPGSLPLALLFFAVTAFLFRRDIKNLGKRTVPFVLYPVVLAAMAGMAAVLPFTLSPRYTLFALGAAAFAVSDLFVARDALTGLTERRRHGALLLYYCALYTMSAQLLIS